MASSPSYDSLSRTWSRALGYCSVRQRGSNIVLISHQSCLRMIIAGQWRPGHVGKGPLNPRGGNDDLTQRQLISI